MPDLEHQLQQLATAVLERVPPVEVAEVVDRRPAPSRRRLAVVALGVAAAVAVVAAVLVVRRDDRAEVDTIAPPGGTSWVDLLAMVPVRDDAPVGDLDITDQARARHLLGRRPLGPDATDAEVIADLEALGGGGTPLSQGAPPAELRAELGFDTRVFDQELLWGHLPARTTVMRGRFDRDVVAAAVAADPIWSPLLDEREYEGVPFWSWGEDYELNDRFSPVRGPGQSARLALVGDVAVWTSGDSELEAALDAIAGRRPTLADDAYYRRAAEEADRHAVVRALFRSGDDILAVRGDTAGSEVHCEPSPCPATPSVLPAEHVPAVWMAGTTFVGDRQREAVAVLVYPDEQAAAAALQPVRDLVAEDDQDPQPGSVEVVDQVVVVVGGGALTFPS